MPLLGFEYNPSYPDMDPYEPQPGGCCTWLLYFNEELGELPITLAQDYTLFPILRHREERLCDQLQAYAGREAGDGRGVPEAPAL